MATPVLAFIIPLSGSGPVDPGWGQMPGYRPDNSLPSAPVRPDNSLPWAPVYPSQGLPRPPVDPGYGRPGWSPVDPGYGRPAWGGWGGGHPDNSLPSAPVRPDNSLPPLPVYPSQGLPVYPSQGLPGGSGGEAGQLPTNPPSYAVVWVPGYGYMLKPLGGEDGETKPVDPAEPK